MYVMTREMTLDGYRVDCPMDTFTILGTSPTLEGALEVLREHVGTYISMTKVTATYVRLRIYDTDLIINRKCHRCVEYNEEGKRTGWITGYDTPEQIGTPGKEIDLGLGVSGYSPKEDPWKT